MVFTGTYEHAIDAKKRLAIPAEVRNRLRREADLAGQHGPLFVYVTLGQGNALCIYTEQGFEQRARELDNSQWEPQRLLEYERLFFSLADHVEIDTQGRIRINDNLLRMARLGTEVVLIGVKDRLEVRDRQAWAAQVSRTLAADPGILMNPRQAMRPSLPGPPQAPDRATNETLERLIMELTARLQTLSAAPAQARTPDASRPAAGPGDGA